MRILLAWLANFAWVLYAGCGVGAIIYAARALSLQRRVGVSLTTFERETTAAQVARLWRAAVAFAAVGLILFLGQAYLLPQIVAEGLPPTPTLTGLVTSTPSPSPTATPLLGSLPTITATVAPLSPPSPPAPPTATQTPPGVSPTYPMEARLGTVAELVGYDLVATEVSSAQTVGLTLYWRALEGTSAVDYTVFTHLLLPDFETNPQALIAQHDGAPAGGTRPTSEWEPGEIIVDQHVLVFYGTGYLGPARIAVGLYDAATQLRVPVEGGGDYVLLPTSISVVPP